MARKLKADAGYSRKLTKNPYNPAWRTMFFTDKSYLLDELADYIVVKALRKSEQEQGLGRNCTLFERGLHGLIPKLWSLKSQCSLCLMAQRCKRPFERYKRRLP